MYKTVFIFLKLWGFNHAISHNIDADNEKQKQ